MTVDQLRTEIEELYRENPDEYSPAHRELFNRFKSKLNAGEIRAAEPVNAGWRVVHWVKEGILIGFRMGELEEYSINEQFRFFDKDTYPLKEVRIEDEIREVPGGTSIRDSAFVGKGVVIMPPAYINAGAYVGEETMVDSHALVGSCAQVGKRVHLSAAAQVGGVLEPVGALPVIIEDNVLVGGGSGIYEGTLVQKNAVIGAGVTLTSGTPLYDLVNEEIIRAEKGGQLVVPENAVVVPGTRPVSGEFANEHGLSVYTPIIVKYRDEKTDRSTALEDSLR